MLNSVTLEQTLADLLEYPSETLPRRAREAETLLMGMPEARAICGPFLHFTATCSLAEAQELYTATFDLDPVCSPYVGYHLFGESYKRGALMAHLRQTYRQYAFDTGVELPDHLSCVLRFLPLADGTLRAEIVGELLVPALRRMLKVLGEATNPYTALLRSLLLVLEPEEAVLAGGEPVD